MNSRTNHALPLLGLFPGGYIAFSSDEVRLFYGLAFTAIACSPQVCTCRFALLQCTRFELLIAPCGTASRGASSSASAQAVASFRWRV